ncbi:unnamed protein product [Parascedosporium putredinis]|uniref:CCHC-type domain-containing protein n=1 Tax=Parascedosporium putredinis TaxID=1442378 RepID=A0A9P1H242_9PEZI|nr:unnamed protein product [Parascedosporium putredinis]CAI7995753.1 unnamed protein product [Parascedosporium putredinis]
MDYSGRACYTCGATNHQARDCPNRGPAKCYNCGNEGHMSRDCPDGPKDSKTCYRCNQPGHISRDCPQEVPRLAARPCGKLGHIARNCMEAGGNSSYGGGGGGGGGYQSYNQGAATEASRSSATAVAAMATCLRITGDCANGSKCYNCGENGHFSRDCPKENTGGEKICYKCQQTGHIQSACPTG